MEMVLMVALQVPRVVALEVAIEVAAVVAQVSLEMSARLTVVVSEDNLRRRHNEMLSPVDLLEDHDFHKILRLLLLRLLLLLLLLLLRMSLVPVAGVPTAHPSPQTHFQIAEDQEGTADALR